MPQSGDVADEKIYNMWSSTRVREAYEQMRRDYNNDADGITRLLVLLIFWSDAGQVTNDRSAHAIEVCLGNQSEEGKYSLRGKVRERGYWRFQRGLYQCVIAPLWFPVLSLPENRRIHPKRGGLD